MGILAKVVLQLGIGSMDLSLLQNYMVLLMLLVFYALQGFAPLKLKREDLKVISIQGLLGSTPVFVLYYLSLQRTSASVTCLLFFTYPIFITLYYMIFEGQKNSWVKTIAVLTAFAGSVLVLDLMPEHIGKLSISGVIFGFASGIAYAFYNIYAEKKLTKYQPGVILFYCTLIIVLAVSCINPLFYRFAFAGNLEAIGITAVIAIVSGILPVVFLYKSIVILGAQIASIVANLEIPMTLLLAALIIGEKLYPIQIAGSILVIFSVLLLKADGKIKTDACASEKGL